MRHLRNRITGCVGCGSFRVMFAGSVMNETPGFRGVSHLVEHCICERVKEIEPEMGMLGLTWNAYTVDTRICCHMSGLIEGVDRLRNRFLDCILNYDIPRDVFERERKVVISEYNENFSDQKAGFWLNFDRVHYGYCGCIGLKSDLENLTYGDFMEFKNRHFSRPSCIGYVHDRGHADIGESWLEEYEGEFGEVEFSEAPERFTVVKRIDRGEPVEPERCAEFGTQRIIMMNTEMDMGEKSVNLAYASVFADVLSGGMSSLLYRELRDKTGNVYSIDVYHEPIGGGRFRLQVLITVRSDVADDMEERLADTLDNADELVTDDDFRVSYAQARNRCLLKARGEYDDDNEFDPFEARIERAVLRGGMDVGGFREFLDAFVSSGLRYFRDDELD